MDATGVSRALFTDLYELTMAQAYWQHDCFAPATFSLYFRNNPPDRAYALLAGVEEALDFIEALRFTDADIAYLRSLSLFDDAFLDWLPSLRFTGDVRAMREGELLFPDEPALEVTAPVIEAQMVETAVINAVNLQTMFATKAARVLHAAQGQAVADFAARRTHGREAADRLARASYIAGFVGTSNVRAAARYSIPPIGTMAHSLIAAFPTEADAFDAYAESFPDTATLLVDTYDSVNGTRHAVETARRLRERGHALRAIRIDSGDLLRLSAECRKLLDDAGLQDVGIIASGGLDEFEIDDLVRAGAPITGFGVGTKLGVSADAPWCDWVYKLVEYDDQPMLKLSPGKATMAGRKQVYRRANADGALRSDLIALIGEDAPPDGSRALLEPAIEQGRRVRPAPALAAVRERAASSLAGFPEAYKALRSPPEYPVEHTWALDELQWGLTQNLLAREMPLP